ncbi:hypothetical protein [Streptomyces anulatus]|uniref:hypothetical protein n=1 Tax=Streptomyces anulatus TaxID=1892 RepID=UPI0016721239|nr:hypothetical protein [Streptomyces anulatus]GGY34448.1 hypothetical protein GCM10010342_21800 [Streptomyces anulatus]
MKDATPEASFDALFVISRVSNEERLISALEIQVFVYLACLLGLYDKRPVSKWGYSFLSTPSAKLFSVDVINAIDFLAGKGLISSDGDTCRIAEAGKRELALWSDLSRFSDRIPYLDGATGASTAMPIATVQEGVSLEPHLSRVTKLNVSRDLLEDSGLVQVYAQFGALEKALGNPVPDYMVPAVVWLSFLLEQSAGTEG